jgi:hypothetical protein
MTAIAVHTRCTGTHLPGGLEREDLLFEREPPSVLVVSLLASCAVIKSAGTLAQLCNWQASYITMSPMLSSSMWAGSGVVVPFWSIRCT